MVRGQPVTSGTVSELVGVPICPDLLVSSDLGEADRVRGRIIRWFFRAMDYWPVR